MRHHLIDESDVDALVESWRVPSPEDVANSSFSMPLDPETSALSPAGRPFRRIQLAHRTQGCAASSAAAAVGGVAQDQQEAPAGLVIFQTAVYEFRRIIVFNGNGLVEPVHYNNV